MTRRANARVAGYAFLLYIAVGVTQMVLGRSTRADGIATRLALVAEHTWQVRTNVLLAVLIGFIAIVLAVALYGLTRDEDHDLAVLALACRVGEGVLGGFPLTTVGLLWLATATTGENALDPAAAQTLAAFLLKFAGWKTLVGAILFAVGSTLFSWLLLRGRSIPVSLARLGVLASLLLVVGLPLQLAGILRGPVAQLMWIPMAVFEIALALWLIIRGVAVPTS